MVQKPDLTKRDAINNSTSMLEVITSTKPVSIATKSTPISSTKVKTLPGENWFSRKLPTSIELLGTTAEDYWKDYQLLGLYKIHGIRNGAPAYKRARNAFIIGRFQ